MACGGESDSDGGGWNAGVDVVDDGIAIGMVVCDFNVSSLLIFFR